ncbi:hypothetical protein VP01_10g5 [Puccinia sorghi]|uniref:Uncharacterized protein n=1 Tax=Puccinia sorghi TaxID=27349 RepID=A0A0L6VSW2_9BASI|nr:hypothetical protein VP01_10g5 [Puccinia sorghi]
MSSPFPNPRPIGRPTSLLKRVQETRGLHHLTADHAITTEFCRCLDHQHREVDIVPAMPTLRGCHWRVFLPSTQSTESGAHDPDMNHLINGYEGWLSRNLLSCMQPAGFLFPFLEQRRVAVASMSAVHDDRQHSAALYYINSNVSDGHPQHPIKPSITHRASQACGQKLKSQPIYTSRHAGIMERLHYPGGILCSDFAASAIYHPEYHEMEHLNRLMAESSLHPHLDMVPYHESLIADQQARQLALLDHETERIHHLHALHQRDRELAEMNDMQHLRLRSLDHQLAMERDMVLGSGSGYGPTSGYGSYHNHALQYPHYSGIMADPYYQQMNCILPRCLPMFSDPYFTDQMSIGHAHSTRPLRSYPLRDPFLHGIDHDYGYGTIGPLSSYGLAAAVPPREYGQMLDDLYLFEMMLRLDRALDQEETLLRWRERLAWEELGQMERRLRWEQMDMMERSRLGIGTGSFWGNQLGGWPIDPTFGYVSPVLTTMAPHGRAPIMGVLDSPHYPLSTPLMSNYPMWDVGGLGIGARISPWIADNDMYLSPRLRARQENIRREYAERRGEIPPGPRLFEPDQCSTWLQHELSRPKYQIRQENLRREYAERRGEIPPVPRLVEPGRMGAALPVYATCSESYRGAIPFSLLFPSSSSLAKS